MRRRPWEAPGRGRWGPPWLLPGRPRCFWRSPRPPPRAALIQPCGPNGLVRPFSRSATRLSKRHQARKRAQSSLLRRSAALRPPRRNLRRTTQRSRGSSSKLPSPNRARTRKSKASPPTHPSTLETARGRGSGRAPRPTRNFRLSSVRAFLVSSLVLPRRTKVCRKSICRRSGLLRPPRP